MNVNLNLERLINGKWVKDDSSVSLLYDLEDDVIDCVIWALNDGSEILVKGNKIRLSIFDQQQI